MSRKNGLRFRKIFLEHDDCFANRAEANEFKRIPLIRLFLFLRSCITGKSENTMDALVKFMGRKPSIDPFVKALNAPLRPRKPFWRRVRGYLGTWREVAGQVRRFITRRRGQDQEREKGKGK